MYNYTENNLARQLDNLSEDKLKKMIHIANDEVHRLNIELLDVLDHKDKLVEELRSRE